MLMTQLRQCYLATRPRVWFDAGVGYYVEAHVIAPLEERFCNVPSAYDIVLPKKKLSNVLLCSSVHPFIGGFILLTFSSLTLTQPDPCR